MNLPVLILAVVTVANAALAALVFLKRPTVIVNRLFALAALSASAWTGTNALFQFAGSVSVALVAAQISSVASLVMSAAFLHFSWEYPLRTPQNTASSHVRLYLLWTVTLLLSLLSLWPGAVDRSVDLTGTHRIITGPGFYLVALFLGVTAVTALAIFARHTLTLRGTLRKQAFYVLAGAGMTAFFSTLFNIIFPVFSDYRLVWLGPSASVFFVAGAVYSIIAHHLFDIRLIIKRAMVYSLLLAAISAAYSAVEYLLTELLGSLSPGESSPLVTHITGAIVVSLWVNPVRKWLEKKIHHLLYPKHRKRRRTGSAESRKHPSKLKTGHAAPAPVSVK